MLQVAVVVIVSLQTTIMAQPMISGPQIETMGGCTGNAIIKGIKNEMICPENCSLSAPNTGDTSSTEPGKAEAMYSREGETEMTKRPCDQDVPPFDRAAERLKQFENARQPQVPKDQAEEKGNRREDKRGEVGHEKRDR